MWHMCLCGYMQEVSGLLEPELQVLGATWSEAELQSSVRAIMLLTIDPSWQPLLCILK